MATQLKAKIRSSDAVSKDFYNLKDPRPGIYMTDMDGHITYANDAFAQILGYSERRDLIGLNLAENFYPCPADRKELLKRIKRMGSVQNYEVQNKRKDGKLLTLSVSSHLIYSDAETIIGIGGVVVDITEKKQHESKIAIFENIFAQIADNVMVTNKEGFIQFVNPAFERTTGFAQTEIFGKTPAILRSGLQPQEYYDMLWNTILAKKVFCTRTINKKKSGEFYTAEQTISPILDQGGEISHFVSIWKDVTQRVKLEEDLHAERQKLEEIIGFDEKISSIRKSEKLMDFVVSKAIRILQAERCSIMLLDRESQMLCLKAGIGFDASRYPLRVRVQDFVAPQVIRTGEPFLVNEAQPGIEFHPQRHYGGKSFMVAPIKRENVVIGVINIADKTDSAKVFDEFDLRVLGAIAREVSVAIENVEFYKELQYLSIIDPLTNIPNLRHFNNSLDYEIRRLKRIPGELTLVMMDIDNFKVYNDTFGHPAGDHLLIEMGKIIQSKLRESDIFCRYAGDEFVVILPGTNKSGALTMAERLRQTIAETKFKIPVTISIGVACYKEKMTRHELMSRADRALYQAKQEGKNQVHVI